MNGNRSGEVASIVSRSFGLSALITAVIAACLLFVLWAPLSQYLGIYLDPSLRGMICAITIMLAANLVIPEVFRGMLFSRLANLVGSTAFNVMFATMVGFCLLVSTQLPLSTILLLLATALLIATIAGSILFFIKAPRPRVPSSASLLSILVTSSPFLTSHIGSFVMLNGDLWVASNSFGPDDAGVYGAASRLALMVGIPSQIGISVIIGNIAHLAALNLRSDIESVARRAATVFALSGLVIALPFVCFGAPLMRAVYGAGFETGGALLATLAVGQLVSTVGGAAQSVMMLSGGQRRVMLLTVGFAFLNYFVASHFGAAHGLIGIAAVYAAGLGAYSCSLILSARLMLGIRTIPSLVELKSIVRLSGHI